MKVTTFYKQAEGELKVSGTFVIAGGHFEGFFCGYTTCFPVHLYDRVLTKQGFLFELVVDRFFKAFPRSF